ncbi:MAG: NADP-dependent oxidoreductase [Enterococcus sp.]
MKAIEIKKYSKELKTTLVERPIPTITESQVLVRVKVAAVNPLDIMNITGAVKFIQNYSMPLILGNELTGIIEQVGKQVEDFNVGDAIYTRLPLEHIGAFAEYVAVEATEIGKLPKNLDFMTGAAAPLTGLTAYQGLYEELEVHAGQTVFIPGGSGSFGQMAIPLAKELGLTVIVSGSPAARERTLAAGADRFIDYKTENYWELLAPVDFVIDTLGAKEFAHELSVLKPGGRLLSLIIGPNKRFAQKHHFSKGKQLLFDLVGKKYDRAAKKKGISYHFIFVRSDGQQLAKLTQIIEKNNIIPAIDPTEFHLETIDQALEFIAHGHPKGKILIQVS